MQESQTVLQHHRAKPTGIVCRRCHSKNVVMSRYRGIEELIASVLPCNICRCVDCYSRFWVVESLFAKTKRVWVWGFLVFLSVAIALLTIKLSEENANLSRTAALIPQFEQHEAAKPEVSSDPVKVSLNEVLSDADAEITKNEDRLLEVAVSQSDDRTQLSDAKLKSVERSIAQKESLERLEQAIIEDKDALESLLKVDMNYRVERWRDSWQSGLADYYLDFYSNNFQPSSGLPLNEWVEQRKKRINPDKKIKIELSNFDVSFSQDMKEAVMKFDQLYSSHTYSEKSRKQLVWIKETDEWKIVSETELNN